MKYQVGDIIIAKGQNGDDMPSYVISVHSTDPLSPLEPGITLCFFNPTRSKIRYVVSAVDYLLKQQRWLHIPVKK